MPVRARPARRCPRASGRMHGKCPNSSRKCHVSTDSARDVTERVVHSKSHRVLHVVQNGARLASPCLKRRDSVRASR
eukprot:6191915-Pleurochrysis_carterae.AAC.1